MAVGALSGCMGAFVAYPFDYIKSQLQTEEGGLRYKNGMDCFKQHVTKSPLGFLDLYRGVGVNLIGLAPEKAIKLTTNDVARAALLSHYGDISMAAGMAAGGFAGACQVIVTNPLEVVKVRTQTSSKSVKEVWKDVGNFGALYEGSAMCITRDVVFSSCLFPIYAYAKVAIPSLLPGVPSFWSGVIAGSLAAAPSAFIATPADFVKTRIQQTREDVNDDDTVGTKNENGMMVAQRILAEEGPLVFFSGWFERVIRSIPQFGVTLAVFDLLNNLANKMWYL